MTDVKWSSFTDAGTPVSGDFLVGLHSGANVRFDATGVVTPAQVQRAAFTFAPTTGVNDAFVVTLSPAPASYTDGMPIYLNTGSLHNLTDSPTLNVNGLGAKTIVTFSGALAPGDMQTDESYILIYNSLTTQFQLINPTVTTADTFLVQQNNYSYSLDTGIVNAYIANILPNNQGVFNGGMPIFLQVVNANTGAATIVINGSSAIPIVTLGNNPLQGGEMLADGLSIMYYSAAYAAFILINSALQNTETATVVVTASSLTMVPNTRYIANKSSLVTLTLPVTSAVGDFLSIVGMGTGGWKVVQGTSQQIAISPDTTTATTGSIASTAQYDSVRLCCLTANTLWAAEGGPQSAGLTIV